MGIGTGLYMYDVVVKKFTFAILSPDEFFFSFFVTLFLWSPYGPLYFHAVVCSSVLLSSPNLSRRRLDVCHTSTHGVALVRI